MPDITPPEENQNNDSKVLPFKKISVEKAIENIYNTVSKKIPLKYETVENKKVIFSFLFISDIKSKRVEVDWLSKFAVGSSAKIKRGLDAKARATATLCCCPPES